MSSCLYVFVLSSFFISSQHHLFSHSTPLCRLFHTLFLSKYIHSILFFLSPASSTFSPCTSIQHLFHTFSLNFSQHSFFSLSPQHLFSPPAPLFSICFTPYLSESLPSILSFLSLLMFPSSLYTYHNYISVFPLSLNTSFISLHIPSLHLSFLSLFPVIILLPLL